MQKRETDEDILTRIGLDTLARTERRRERRAFRTAMAFMFPAVAFVSIVLLFPVLYNIYISLTKWRRFSGFDEFAGARNYTRMIDNPFFGDALAGRLVAGGTG